MKKNILDKALQSLGIEALNEMQEATIEASGKNNHLVLLSPTGSGKTLAFLFPLLNRLKSEVQEIQAVIIAPSRELALQIEYVFRELKSGFRVCCCYGGHAVAVEARSLALPPAVLIGTPGRLVDHLNRRNICLDNATTVVLDEYDKMVELGFHEELKEIFAALHGLQHRILTSATSTGELPVFLGMNSFQTLNFIRPETSDRLSVKQVVAEEYDTYETLFRLLCSLGDTTSLIFCNFREKAEELSSYLKQCRIDNTCYHGGMEQDEREFALCKFRNGSVNTLIATDLASRGLDIPAINNIIHYQFPDSEAAYIHRNGRTARMHSSGSVFLIRPLNKEIPEYIGEPEQYFLPQKTSSPSPTPWATLYIGRGKKEKLSKSDIVGFLCQQGDLAKDEIGQIEIKDFHAYVAIRRDKIRDLLPKIREEKIKNKKTKFRMV